MPPRRERTDAERLALEDVRREQNKLAQRRRRARQHDGQRDAEVSMTAGQHDVPSGHGTVSLTPPHTPPIGGSGETSDVSFKTTIPPSPTAALAPTGSASSARFRLLEAPAKPAPIEEVLAELFGPPGTPREQQTRTAAANQFKAGAKEAGVSLLEQACRIRVAYRRYCESWDAVCTPMALAKHFGELLSDHGARRPVRVRREVVQRMTHYASRRVEPSFGDLMDDHGREAGG